MTAQKEIEAFVGLVFLVIIGYFLLSPLYNLVVQSTGINSIASQTAASIMQDFSSFTQSIIVFFDPTDDIIMGVIATILIFWKRSQSKRDG